MTYVLSKHLKGLSGPVLITGHTGFKGAWMTFLLQFLGVPVVGYSLPARRESLFERADRVGSILESFADIREYKTLSEFINSVKPSVILHFAAQPLVLNSYASPRDTFEINVQGTVNVLDIAFKTDFVQAIGVITTDKVYKNENRNFSFHEDDPLLGKDPYSASKVAAEAAISAWQQISKVSNGPKVLSLRAGNVIGGGDWADNRLIPDLIKGALLDQKVLIRNPKSTRPWQHVLDPLIGYLKAIEHVLQGNDVSAINFGPNGTSLSVENVIEIVLSNLTFQKLQVEIKPEKNSMESEFLQLDSSLAKSILDWSCRWSQQEAITRTINWWNQYYQGEFDSKNLCELDIKSYLQEI